MSSSSPMKLSPQPISSRPHLRLSQTRKPSSFLFPNPPFRPISLPRISRRPRRAIPPTKAASVAGAPPSPGDGGRRTVAGLGERVRAGIALLRSVLPGGSWWELQGEGAKGGESRGKVVTVRFALGRMWELVRDDKWVIFFGFASLVLASASEISIPNFLAASIFSVQSGETAAFYRNTKLLVLLCAAAGICSGIRGCCFGIANMILVKRMREKLYSTLLFQDISFFDNETVGDLTSRLGSDCQQVSRVIGNDLNLISRSIIQFFFRGQGH